jgi:thioredoxin-related protein
MTYLDAEGGKRITLPNGERLTEAEYGTRLRAFVTPVFVFMTADGSELLKRVGMQTAEGLLNADRFIREEHYKTISYEIFLNKYVNKDKNG